ncbi:MAG: glycine cleavage system aminomethyltransferase GcvT [Acidimicrobiales bacterium]
MTSSELQRTALHDWHVDHGGRIVDFAGWALPVFYETGALAEHHGTRGSVGLFDIDHMGQVDVVGPDAVAAVDRLVTSDVAAVPIGSSTYGLLCNEEGCVIDDVFVYRTGINALMVVVNASNRIVDREWIVANTAEHDCVVTDRSDPLEMIAVQGPNAIDLMDAAVPGVSELDRFGIREIEIFGRSALVGRTGYTGEDGVELYIEGGVVDVWTGLLDLASSRSIDALAVGLGARDSLRFEPGFPLYGHELGLDINPFEARLSWAVDLDGVSFIGKEALVAAKATGLSRRLETIVLTEKGVPREGTPVLDADGTQVSEVVSGMFAPSADVFAANVFLPRHLGDVGTPVAVEIRGSAKSAEVVKRPLYRRAEA